MNHETVCDAVAAIKDLLDDIEAVARRARKYSSGDPAELLEAIDNMDNAADRVLDGVVAVHKMAQRMEDRLRAYRSAIEGLGFLREKGAK
jgi:hypothetical protein